MSSRIAEKFSSLSLAGRRAFVPYITAGDPTLSATRDLVFALERAGADLIELGVPFSDPLADGEVNQAAAFRALQAGASVEGVLETIAEIRKISEIPLVLFSYLNPLLQFGLARFATEASRAGVDGVLLVDLPLEERLPGLQVLESLLARIHLVAPTTEIPRRQAIGKAAEGFLYCVARLGTTGVREQAPAEAEGLVRSMRTFCTVPACVGFGISTPEQAVSVAAYADGVVVGSALVERIGAWGSEPDLCERIERFARPLAEGVHRASGKGGARGAHPRELKGERGTVGNSCA
ncbi:tryptophan synthase subunit alpha [Methylacidimicrobium tartarophylax]|uniref:Tryptophan synthase alpha chain n=1 Tax=Methylacidimicrobium tartarophylax TaxID=1041768 RepID=A0A5E6M625_9BACT|nr:tryptophan synthase subunit alpha [Methylacidimicrobium tartarophylax]VVM05004.1 tryptophan synthase alpha chain [Methylacidimicrobium tartarophylax]